MFGNTRNVAHNNLQLRHEAYYQSITYVYFSCSNFVSNPSVLLLPCQYDRLVLSVVQIVLGQSQRVRVAILQE